MNKRPALKAGLSITVGIFSLILAVTSFNRAWASSCGQDFRGPGTFTLDSDVGPCSGPNAAIEVHGPATLNMAGHTVSCDNNSSSVGIFMLGDGVKVSNGTVTNCGSGYGNFGDGDSFTKNKAIGNQIGFVVGGGKTEVTGSEATGNELTGFQITGDSDRLTGNTASSNGGIGFDIGASHTKLLKNNKADKNGTDGFLLDEGGVSNSLTKCTATNNGLNGFDIDGNGNTFESDIANSNEQNGFDINNQDNTLSHNTANNNQISGFNIFAGNNTLMSNTAVGNQNNAFTMESDDNTLSRNTAKNSVNGIHISNGMVGNHIIKNTSKVNTIDLKDANGECHSNLWKKNKFGTKDPACIH